MSCPQMLLFKLFGILFIAYSIKQFVRSINHWLVSPYLYYLWVWSDVAQAMASCYVQKVQQEGAPEACPACSEEKLEDGSEIQGQKWCQTSARGSFNLIYISYYFIIVSWEMYEWIIWIVSWFMYKIGWTFQPRSGAKHLKQSQVYPKKYGVQVAQHHLASRPCGLWSRWGWMWVMP